MNETELEKVNAEECPYCTMGGKMGNDMPEKYIIDVKQEYGDKKKDCGIKFTAVGQVDSLSKELTLGLIMNDTAVMPTQHVKINYCPMCGRKL